MNEENEARCRSIFIACLARLSGEQCREVLEELQIELGSEKYGVKHVLFAEFEDAITEEGA